MKPGAKLDKAVEEAANPNLTGDQLADLFTRIATMGYFMSTEVGRLHRNFLQAEADWKRYAAKTVIVRTMDGTSNAKAVAALESSDNLWDTRRHGDRCGSGIPSLSVEVGRVQGRIE